MLNEKVTVTICGKAYNLRTDNASSLIRQGEEADRRITEYCREMSLSKDDACVFTVLDLLGDLEEGGGVIQLLRDQFVTEYRTKIIGCHWLKCSRI